MPRSFARRHTQQIILHLLHNKDYKGEMENLVGSRDINKVFENPSQSIISCKERSKLRFFSFEDILIFEAKINVRIVGAKIQLHIWQIIGDVLHHQCFSLTL